MLRIRVGGAALAALLLASCASTEPAPPLQMPYVACLEPDGKAAHHVGVIVLNYEPAGNEWSYRVVRIGDPSQQVYRVTCSDCIQAFCPRHIPRPQGMAMKAD